MRADGYYLRMGDNVTRRFAIIWLVILAGLATGCGSLGGMAGPSAGVPENAPPLVTTVSPPADAAAPADSPITVTFSKPMSPATLEISAEPAVVFKPPAWSEDGRTASVRADPPLTAGIRYAVRVRARDRLGNALVSDYVWSFSATVASGVSGEGHLRIAERVEIGLDARVFTLYAALLAAGSTTIGEPGPAYAALKTKMGGLPARVVDPVRRYFADHPARLEQHVAAALALSPPPEFRETGGTLGLGPLLSRFYADANVADVWKSDEKANAAALEAYRRGAPAVLGRAADFMRVTAVPGGRITIIPMSGAGQGQGVLVRQGDRLVVVVAAGESVDRLGLLRPFVRLLLEPVRGKALDHLQRTEPIFAQTREVAARFGYRTWHDVVIESLADATAVRLVLSGDDATAALRASYARGLVLVDHFTEQMADYERGTVPLADAYSGLLAAVKVEAELKRWAERKPN